MEIARIVSLGLVGTALTIFISQYNKDFGMYIRIAVGIIIFLFIFSKLSTAIGVLSDIISKTNISSEYIKIILKVIGIAYIAEFGSGICKDVKEEATAAKIEFAGKILIMLVALPIVSAIIEVVSKFFM